jgi:hypothetical protein
MGKKAAKKKSTGKKAADRRQSVRFFVAEETKGRVTSAYEALLMNISRRGALIEHDDVVRPGSTSSLELELNGNKVKLQSRVVWSAVVRQGLNADSEMALIFNTGLEFLDLSEETQQLIGDYIDSMAEQGKAMPVDERSVRRSYTCEECNALFELTDAEVRPVVVEPQRRPVQAGDLFEYAHGRCRGTLQYATGPLIPWIGEEEEM